jgi:hypothetical protein
VRASAGLDAQDAVGGKRAVAHEELGVLARVDVVGDDGKVQVVAEPFAEAQDKHGLAGTDGASDAQTNSAYREYSVRR